MVPTDRISRVIFDYAAQIGAAQDLDALLELNAGMARDLVGADRCSIWLVDTKNNRLWTKVAHGVRELHIPIGQGLVGACVARNEAILVNDTSQDRAVPEKRGQGKRVRHEIHSDAAAARHGRKAHGRAAGPEQTGRILAGRRGLAGIVQRLFGIHFGNAAAAQGSGGGAASACRNWKSRGTCSSTCCRKSLPPIPGLDYAGYCRSAKFVGGDYYDFLPMPDGGLLFTLGDVSGKGIAAAVLMASMQASLRSQVVKDARFHCNADRGFE